MHSLSFFTPDCRLRLLSSHGSCPASLKAGPFPCFGSVSLRRNGCGAQTSVRIRCGESGGDDGYYMRRCVELSRTAIGRTSPNPMVGCVIVKDGEVVGEGFHPKAGQPHAEVFALNEAGSLAENATAYVSLEPCNHYGRTPPCTEALLKAKVKRVVVGMVDPDPLVASKGVDKLRAAGVEVTVGVEEELCRNHYESYIHHRLVGKPFVTLRYSIALNGQIVDKIGEGADKCGGYYSKLLQEYDAVIVSSALLAKQLSVPTSQEPGANQPMKIVISRGSDPNLNAPALASEFGFKFIIFSDKEIARWPNPAADGIETVVSDQVSMHEISEYCKHQGFCNVLVDLRGNIKDLEDLIKEGIENNLLQKVLVEVLPVWDENDVGGSAKLARIAKGLKVKALKPKVYGENIVLEGYF